MFSLPADFALVKETKKFYHIDRVFKRTATTVTMIASVKYLSTSCFVTDVAPNRFVAITDRSLLKAEVVFVELDAAT